MQVRILLIVRGEKAYSAKRIKAELKKKKIDSTVLRWGDLRFFEGRIYRNNKKIELKKYKTIFFQSPLYYAVKGGKILHVFKLANELSLIVRMLEESGSGIVNQKIVSNYPYYDKFNQAYIFKKHKIPSIPTMHLADNKMDKVESALKNVKISYPLVVKESFGGAGDGVYMAKTREQLKKIINNKRSRNLIFQPFIKNDGDYRVIVCGGKSLGIMKRVAKKSEWRNNFSQGATVEQHKDARMERFAEKICRKIGFDYAGVDILKIKNKFLVIEINIVPDFKGFECVYPKINVAEKIVKMLEGK